MANPTDEAIRECETACILDDFVGCGINSHIVGQNSCGLWIEEVERLIWAQLEAPKGNSVVLGSHNSASEVILGLTKAFKKDSSKIFGVDLKFGEYHKLNLSRLKSRCPDQEVVSWEMNSKDFGEVYGEFTGHENIGLVLIDSYHSFKHIADEYSSIKPYLTQGSIVLFHDNSPTFPKRGLYYEDPSTIIDDSEDFMCDEAISYILDTNDNLEEVELPGPKCEHFQETGLTEWKRKLTSPFSALAAVRVKQSLYS